MNPLVFGEKYSKMKKPKQRQIPIEQLNVLFRHYLI